MNAPGTTLTGYYQKVLQELDTHDLTGAFGLVLKHKSKYPGCSLSIQKAYADRRGLASE
jgi:hypothetical protein